MSIINDALKKAAQQKNFSQDKLYQTFKAIDNSRKEQEKRICRRWLIWIFLGLFCILGISLASNHFQTDSHFLNQGLRETDFIPEKFAPNLFQLRRIDFEQPAKSFNFTLSGILYDQQRPMAIINDRIVSKGAFIEGARLLEIQPDSVKLNFKGKEYTLTVK